MNTIPNSLETSTAMMIPSTMSSSESSMVRPLYPRRVARKRVHQFGTWASVGGEGDPVRAPEPEQDRRAALLIKRSGGSSPWPICD